MLEPEGSRADADELQEALESFVMALKRMT